MTTHELGGQIDAISGPSTLTGSLYSYPLCDIRNTDGLQIDEIHFESIYAGEQSAKQQFTIRNNSTDTLNLTLTSEALTVPVGSAIDTYLSTYFSADNTTYSPSLPVEILSNDTQDFYVYYQPPSTGKIGEKEWQTDLGGNPVPDVTLLENWFYINPVEVEGGASEETDCPVIIPLPFQSGLMSNFNDLRFCLSDGTLLDWGISERTVATDIKAIVTVPTLPASPGTLMIYAYGANALANQGYTSTLNDYGFADGTLLPWVTTQGGEGVTVVNNADIGCNVVNLKTYPTSFDKWEVTIARPAYDDYGTFKCTFAYNFYGSWIQLYFKPISTTNTLTGDGYGVIMDYHPSYYHNPAFSIVKYKNGTPTTLAIFRPTDWTAGSKPTIHDPQELIFTRTEAGVMTLSFNGVVLCSATDTEEFTSNYMILKRYCNAVYDVYIKLGDYTSFPAGTVTPGDWNFYLTPKTIKAAILYKSRELPEFEPRIRHGCRIGGVLYE
jgi:hypothetical protein